MTCLMQSWAVCWLESRGWNEDKYKEEKQSLKTHNKPYFRAAGSRDMQLRGKAGACVALFFISNEALPSLAFISGRLVMHTTGNWQQGCCKALCDLLCLWCRTCPTRDGFWWLLLLRIPQRENFTLGEAQKHKLQEEKREEDEGNKACDCVGQTLLPWGILCCAS
ncbi:hypothetical protein E2320_000257 [Naja naja]|nr:hypothetical protein E2320_000257 [Naja naja]